jgi:hypothetical protein
MKTVMELPGSVNSEVFQQYLSNYEILKKVSAAYSLTITVFGQIKMPLVAVEEHVVPHGNRDANFQYQRTRYYATCNVYLCT